MQEPLLQSWTLIMYTLNASKIVEQLNVPERPLTFLEHLILLEVTVSIDTTLRFARSNIFLRPQ